MSDTLRLAGGGRSIDLYPWLSAKAKGQEALAGILGFGLPGVTNQWFEGAGSSTWRGSRVERRKITLPLKVYADTRKQLNELLSEMSVMLDPFVARPDVERGTARLFFGMPDDNEWFVDVVRSGGGDWSRKVDSDDRTYFKTTIELEAADAFWTRNNPEKFEVKQQPSGNPLLPKIARLRVGSSATTGERAVTNIGDTWAWPMMTLVGPTTGLTLIGPNGEVLRWDGVLEDDEVLYIDMRNNTVTDETGTNRYGNLAPAPRFWYIAPGTSSVTVILEDSSPETILTANWWPRRWAVV